MLSTVSGKNWEKWYPNKIHLKNFKKKTFLNDLDQFLDKDFFEYIDNTKNLKENKNHKTKEFNLIKEKFFEEGFKQGILKQKEENIFLKNKLTIFFSEFEKSFSDFEDKLYSQLIKIILTVSSYIIGKKIRFDKSILIKNLKDVINKEGIFLKNPKLLVHPSNKSLIEETFRDVLKNYKWELVYDVNTDINGFKIRSENSNVEATMSSRLHELCRLIGSAEEY